jgi:TPR repeat protein
LNLSSDILVVKVCFQIQLVPLHHGDAAQNIAAMYSLGTGGVARSKLRAMQWRRKAADKGVRQPCMVLAGDMYADRPHAREVGHVEVEATGVALTAADMEGHDHVSPEVLTSVGHWVRKACVTGGPTPLDLLEGFRRAAVEGAPYCVNDGCEVVGHLKDFKVCKIARYCSDACQKQDWSKHKAMCGTTASLLA